MSRLSLGLLIAFLSIVADAVPARAADPPQNSAPSKQPAGQVNAQPAKPASPAGGMTVFIDPATGQIRQPDPSEIGSLAPPVSPAPKAPEPLPMRGPGGAVGAKLGPDSMSYTVLTMTPDGKDAIDCVAGEKAASALLAAPPTSKPKEASNPPQETHSRNSSGGQAEGLPHPPPQDTQHVKNPR